MLLILSPDIPPAGSSPYPSPELHPGHEQSWNYLCCQLQLEYDQRGTELAAPRQDTSFSVRLVRREQSYSTVNIKSNSSRGNNCIWILHVQKQPCFQWQIHIQSVHLATLLIYQLYLAKQPHWQSVSFQVKSSIIARSLELRSSSNIASLSTVYMNTPLHSYLVEIPFLILQL